MLVEILEPAEVECGNFQMLRLQDHLMRKLSALLDLEADLLQELFALAGMYRALTMPGESMKLPSDRISFI